MIYEKRNLNNSCSRNRQGEEMCTGIITARALPSVTEYPRQENSEYKIPDYYNIEHKYGNEYRKGKRIKRHIPRKIMLGLCTLIFCVFTIDNRLNNGFLTGLVKEYAVNIMQKTDLSEIFGGVKADSTEISDESEQQDVFEQSEIPLTMTQENEKDVLTQDILEEAQTDTMPEPDIAVEVTGSQNKSVYSDGELFYPITTLDLSAQNVTDLTNGTVYKPDMEKIKNTYPKALENMSIEEEPLVLIVHTHAGETYTQYKDMYPADEKTRSEDTNENVVRVGKEMAQTLEDYGISTIHCTTLCDKESFIDAYNVSHDEVQRYLEEYPSIKIVIDVHRDAIIRQNGESIRPAVRIAGQDYAQLMFVAGTGQSAHSHPNWEQNLSLALLLQSKAQERYPGLFRPINLRSVPFNQWLSPGYLLLEVGSNANTLDEALLSAQAFAVTLSQVLKESMA